MRIKTIELYQFDELSDKAKEKAREWYREGMYDYDWYDSTYEDAKNIGLEITEFDIDRRSIKGHFLASAEETAHKIETEHGETCETYTTAKDYLKKRDTVIDLQARDENSEFIDTYDLDDKLDELDEAFLKDLLQDYFKILKNETEYLESNESVDENIKCNEYEFTKEGLRS